MDALEETTIDFGVLPWNADPKRRLGEAALPAFIDHMPGLAAVRDQHGRCIVANDAYQQVTGSDPEAPAVTPVPSTELQRVHRTLDRDAAHALRTNAPTRGRLTYETDQGTRHASTVTFPLAGPDGEPRVCMLGFDVTELVELRRAVAASEDRSRGMFDRATMPMVIVGLDGRIREGNPALCYLFGYRPSEVRQMDSSRLFIADELVDLWRSALDPRSARHGYHQTTVTCVLSDGRSLPAGLTVVLARNADGTPQHFLGLVDPVDDAERGLVASPQNRIKLLPVEVAILEGLAAGYSHVQIAAKLHFSRQGVDYHLDKLRRKLAAPSRAAIVSRAYTLDLFIPGKWLPKIRYANRVSRDRDLWAVDAPGSRAEKTG
jgi:PAS domain S-box-containing protein